MQLPKRDLGLNKRSRGREWEALSPTLLFLTANQDALHAF